MLFRSATWASLIGAEPPAQAESTRATIAVLPLANQSGDGKRDYFGDGITQDIITALGRFSGLLVIANSAVQPYKSRNASPEEIGRDLGVRYVLHGNVRQSDEKLRLLVELTDTGRGTQLWSERFDGEGKDVFAIQDQIVRKVVGVLAVKITRLEQQRVAAKPVENLLAYDLVLRARELLVRTERGANREARTLGAQALQLAPNYAEAFLVLAAAEWQRAELGWMEDPVEGVKRSEDYAKRALAFDDPGVQARAHARLGAVYGVRGQYEQALVQVERAVELNPNDADAYAIRADTLLWQGRIEEAVAAHAIARQFDPRPPSSNGISMALTFIMANRLQDALAVTSDFLARYPNNAFLHAMRAAAFAQLGDAKEASASAATVRRMNPTFQAERFGTRFRNPADAAKIQAALRKAGL